MVSVAIFFFSFLQKRKRKTRFCRTRRKNLDPIGNFKDFSGRSQLSYVASIKRFVYTNCKPLVKYATAIEIRARQFQLAKLNSRSKPRYYETFLFTCTAQCCVTNTSGQLRATQSDTYRVFGCSSSILSHLVAENKSRPCEQIHDGHSQLSVTQSGYFNTRCRGFGHRCQLRSEQWAADKDGGATGGRFQTRMRDSYNILNHIFMSPILGNILPFLQQKKKMEQLKVLTITHLLLHFISCQISVWGKNKNKCKSSKLSVLLLHMFNTKTTFPISTAMFIYTCDRRYILFY